MRIQTIAAVAAIGVALSGCATIVDGSKQSVSVSTSPVQGAACTLHNSEGTWYVTTPGSVEVHKTKNDLEITCTKDGFQPGKQVATSKFGGATFGAISACASAKVRAAAGSTFGDGAWSDAACLSSSARPDASSSCPRLYQQWRPVPRSI